MGETRNKSICKTPTIDSFAQLRIFDSLDTADQILNQSILVSRFPTNNLPQCCRLNKIRIGDFTGKSRYLTCPFLVLGMNTQCLGGDLFDVLVEDGWFD